jgi:hypothetical protein
MEKKRKKRPADINQLAASILMDAISDKRPDPQQEPTTQQAEKNPAAVALGRLGGLKGGKARAEKLSAAKRKEIAQKAAKARWRNRSNPPK